MALYDFLPLIKDKIQDTAEKLSLTLIQEALQTAVISDYSRLSPRHVVLEITGDGASVTFDLPSGFEEGFSAVVQIEYPVGRQVPEYLDQEDYTSLYRDVTGARKLRFFSMTLPLAATALVEYTRRHHVQNAPPPGETLSDTVPIVHRDAVASMAASYCCLMLANFYAQSSDPTIGADAVDYGGLSDKYLALAREYRMSFGRTFGASEGVVGASAVMDLDVDLQGGLDRFYHPRRDR